MTPGKGKTVPEATPAPGHGTKTAATGYSTVTDLARLRGWSTSAPRRRPVW